MALVLYYLDVFFDNLDRHRFGVCLGVTGFIWFWGFVTRAWMRHSQFFRSATCFFTTLHFYFFSWLQRHFLAKGPASKHIPGSTHFTGVCVLSFGGRRGEKLIIFASYIRITG
ncbi:hypothetical protein F5Y05DRAFT_333695 [Hypoxylon sp. FL0543]|nr:hypothetical protein F5Y05DRAFT_333695 [Hypoxylon sp. FL0543]